MTFDHCICVSSFLYFLNHHYFYAHMPSFWGLQVRYDITNDYDVNEMMPHLIEWRYFWVSDLKKFHISYRSLPRIEHWVLIDVDEHNSSSQHFRDRLSSYWATLKVSVNSFWYFHYLLSKLYHYYRGAVQGFETSPFHNLDNAYQTISTSQRVKVVYSINLQRVFNSS